MWQLLRHTTIAIPVKYYDKAKFRQGVRAHSHESAPTKANKRQRNYEGTNEQD